MAEESHFGLNLDYSKSVFKKMKEEVCIICHEKDDDGNEHGEFWQTPENHIRLKQGCPICGKKRSSEKRRTPYPIQIEKAKRIFGDKYIYPDIDSVNNSTPIPIECPIHGIFWRDLNDHIDGKQGCPDCAVERRKSLKYGVGVNDLLYAENDRAYSYWNSMLRRCYSEYALIKNPAYRGCSVCEEWLVYSNFKRWFDENYIEGYELDKDILCKGNRVYCPDNCCFVPKRINIMLINNRRARGKYPLGVSSKDGQKFDVTIGGVYKGRFDSVSDAFNHYKAIREKEIKEVANEYYSDGRITKQVYDALMNWTIEITD